MSAAEELKAAWWALKAKRIKVGSCHATRASSLGNECERFLVYEQTKAELRAMHGPELQAIFDLGNELERYVVRELEDMGAEIVQRGRDYEDRRLNLTGHVDVKVRLPSWPKPVTAEIKGLNPYTAESIATIDDIKASRQAWVRKYYAQLQAYLFLDGSEVGVFVLLNKVSGQIEFIECPLDYEFAEGLLKKAERVKAAVASETLPERHRSEECERCPFAHVCLPDIDFGPGVQILDNAELEALLLKREALKEAAAEYAAIDKSIKKALPHSPEMLLGEWVVKASEVSRKGYEVKPSSYWTFDISRINKGAHNAG